MTSKWMDFAIAQAIEAGQRGDVPIGAVLVQEGKLLASAGNCVEELFDPTAHAEILVIQKASRQLKTPRLLGIDLYVTLEPCPMCATAISFARINCVYFGAFDPKGGGIDHGPRIFDQSTCHHRPEVYGGIKEQECASLLTDFFVGKR